MIYNLIATNTIDEGLLKRSQEKGALMEMFSMDEEVEDATLPSLPESIGIPSSPAKHAQKWTKDQRASLQDSEFQRRRAQLIQYVQAFQAQASKGGDQEAIGNDEIGQEQHSQHFIAHGGISSYGQDTSLDCEKMFS